MCLVQKRRAAMSTDIAVRPVLRPAGNVARANLRKVTKPPPSPTKPPTLPHSAKNSPPNSQPSTPKTAISSPARSALLKPLSPCKLPPSLSPKKPPTTAATHNKPCLQPGNELVLEAPLELAIDGSKSAISGSDPAVSGSNPAIGGSNASLIRPKPSLNGSKPSLTGSKSSFNGSKPSMSGSKAAPIGPNPPPDLPYAPVFKTQKATDPYISLTKSSCDVFQKSGNSSYVKAKTTSKKNLSKLGSLSFDESSLATMVAAKKAATNEVNAQRKLKVAEYGRKQGKASRVAPDISSFLLPPPVELKRCKFITAQSDPLYVAYHDEEWGVPVHDDRMLFELLVLAGFQVELSWSTILHKRDAYRATFSGFDASAVAMFSEKHIQLLEADKSLGLPGRKIRGVVENARRILEVVHEFGSLNDYLWGFLNKQPMMNNHRHPKQVPVKTSKSESISKDLVKRGFQLVGPTIIYSLMQAAGMTNDHLVQCFRHHECVKLASPSSVDVAEEMQHCLRPHDDKVCEIFSLNLDFSQEVQGGQEGHCTDQWRQSEQDEQPQQLEVCTYTRELEDQESTDGNAV